VTTVVTSTAPHYLIAEGSPLAVRRTRGGDAWQARRDGTEAGGANTGSTGTQVLLGMPAVGVPVS